MEGIDWVIGTVTEVFAFFFGRTDFHVLSSIVAK